MGPAGAGAPPGAGGVPAALGSFPREPYGVQREFVGAAYAALGRGGAAVLESPTGTGKTLSLICSVLQWVEDQRAAAARGEGAGAGEPSGKPAGKPMADGPAWLQAAMEGKAADDRAAKERRLRERLERARERRARVEEGRRALRGAFSGARDRGARSGGSAAGGGGRRPFRRRPRGRPPSPSTLGIAGTRPGGLRAGLGGGAGGSRTSSILRTWRAEEAPVTPSAPTWMRS